VDRFDLIDMTPTLLIKGMKLHVASNEEEICYMFRDRDTGYMLHITVLYSMRRRVKMKGQDGAHKCCITSLR